MVTFQWLVATSTQPACRPGRRFPERIAGPSRRSVKGTSGGQQNAPGPGVHDEQGRAHPAGGNASAPIPSRTEVGAGGFRGAREDTRRVFTGSSGGDLSLSSPNHDGAAVVAGPGSRAAGVNLPNPPPSLETQAWGRVTAPPSGGLRDRRRAVVVSEKPGTHGLQQPVVRRADCRRSGSILGRLFGEERVPDAGT